MYPEDYLNREDEKGVYLFSSPFDPLNNWSAHTVEAFGKVFYTLEHAYHYKKFVENNPEIADRIKTAPSPWAAMKIARKYDDLRSSDWEKTKVSIMEELLRLKLLQNDDVALVLEKTGRQNDL